MSEQDNNTIISESLTEPISEHLVSEKDNKKGREGEWTREREIKTHLQKVGHPDERFSFDLRFRIASPELLRHFRQNTFHLLQLLKHPAFEILPREVRLQAEVSLPVELHDHVGEL